MDSFEVNKIAGAVLGAMLFAMGLNIAADMIFAPHRPAVPGYDLPADEPAAAAGGKQEAPSEPLPVLLAKAEAAAGEKATAACKSCHTFEAGGANKIGPNLYGVVGRPIASHEGFNYSQALKSKGGEWTFENLFAFIANPKGWAPGTIMNFAGVPKPEQRANVLVYLNTLSQSPKPLPKPEQAAQPQPAAQPAQGQGGQPGQPQPAQGQPAQAQQPQGQPPAGAQPAAAPQPGAPQSGQGNQPATQPRLGTDQPAHPQGDQAVGQPTESRPQPGQPVLQGEQPQKQ